MAAVNSEHGGCEPKPPDRCESSFSGPGIQISGPGRLSKGSSHPEAPLNQSVDDKLKYMPMEDFKVLLNVLHEARKDKSKLKSANSEQAEIISELEQQSKSSSHPEEPIPSLNVKFTSSLQSLNHQEVLSSTSSTTSEGSTRANNSRSTPTNSIYSVYSDIKSVISSSNASSATTVTWTSDSCYNSSGDQMPNQPPSTAIDNSSNQPKPATVPYNIPSYYKNNNNNNCALTTKMGSEPLAGGLATAHDERNPGHPNHNCTNEIDMEDVEEEASTPTQYFFTSKDNTQQLIDATDPISNSPETDGLHEFYPGESHSTKHVGTGTHIDSKDEFGNRNSSIPLHDDYSTVTSITGPGGLSKNSMELPRPSTPTYTGMLKNTDGNVDRSARYRMNERSSKNKRKPPKGETSVRQEELPGFVGDQEDIEKLVQFVEGRPSLNKKNSKDKKQREVRSKSKEKEPVKAPVSLTPNAGPNPDLTSKPSVAGNTMPSTDLVQNESKTETSQPAKKETKGCVKGEKSGVSGKADEEKQVGDEAGSEYTLVKKKRKPKQRTTPSKESFPRGDQTRREPVRSRRSGGSRRKSVGSVPGSENSASDGEDSVKSLPADCSSSEKVPKPCISSGGTPQTSYAEIVRIARDEERKKYGSPGSWMKTTGAESIKIDEFPDMKVDTEDSPTTIEKISSTQSDQTPRNVKSNPHKTSYESATPVSNGILSAVSSVVESMDKNSPETCRVDSSNDNISIAPSVPFSEPLVPVFVPTSKVINTNIDRRNSSNDGFSTLNIAKSRQWSSGAGSRETRGVRSNEGKSGQLASPGVSNQSKGSVRNVQAHPKLDNNSYLAKAAQNVGHSLSSASGSGNSSVINSNQDVGFPALVSSEGYCPPPPMTQGPWSNRLKQTADKSSKESPKSSEKANSNSSLPVKQVNGVADEHAKEVHGHRNARSQQNPSVFSPKKTSSPLTVGKESPKGDTLTPAGAEKGDNGSCVESSTKEQKEESVRTIEDSSNSSTEKTEETKLNASDQTLMKKVPSQDAVKVEGPKVANVSEVSKGQANNRKDTTKKKFGNERTNWRTVEKFKLVDSSTKSDSYNPCPSMINGDATESEKSKLLPQPEVSDDGRIICPDKSYICSDINNSMPVVFCGENFKETPNRLPDKSFGFEFGFGVTEIMDSAYANTQVNSIEPVPEIVDEESVVEKTISDGLEDVSSVPLDDDYSATSPERQPSPKSSMDDLQSPPPIEIGSSSVRTNQSNSTPHNTRHKHSSSSTYHRNYQFMATNPYNFATIPQQPGQMPRNLHMMPPNQYIPGQAMPRGASPIPAYAPTAYPPPHLQPQGVPPMNMAVAYSTQPLIHIGNRTMPDPNPGQSYHLTAAIQQPLVPAFSVGMYKVPGSTGNEQVAPPGNSPSTPQPGAKQVNEIPSSDASSAYKSWEGSCMEENFDVAQFFVPIPSTISAVTEREVQKFMDDYVKKLNDLCASGRIKFHQI